MTETQTLVEQAPRAPLTAGPETVIRFPEGLPGLEQAHDWQMVEHEDAAPFLWLQSVDRPAISLLVVDPLVVAADYDPKLSVHDLARVGLVADEPRVVLAVVTWRDDGPTVNLRAPLVLNPTRMLGAQVILEEARWPLRHTIASGQD